jgi:hypothetical protein
MTDHRDDQEQHPPRWVPYTPPAPDGWDRFRLFLRRLSFPLVVLLLAAGLGGVLFYWGDEPAPRPADGSSATVLPSGMEEGARGRNGEVGPLRVRSSPEGATVRVNGDSVGVTPFTDSARTAGVYMLSVQHEGHFRADTVVVLDDAAAATVRFALRPRPGYDGPADTRAAREPVPGRQPRPQRRSPPAPAAPSPAAPPAPAFGALYVTSTPSGASVAVNGTERGRTPLPLSRIKPGEQRVALTLEGYQPWSTRVNVDADTTARVNAKLRPRTGRLRVLARPWGTIYIDETLHARESDVWYETELPAGAHQVTVVHPVLGRQTRQVTLRAGEEHSVIVELRPPAADTTSR